jgi:hypothetical protein
MQVEAGSYEAFRLILSTFFAPYIHLSRGLLSRIDQLKDPPAGMTALKHLPDQ